VTTESTIDEPIDHDAQLQRMIDAYQRPVMAAVKRWFPFAAEATVDRDHIQQLLHQGIEQAFDAGHACQPGHQPGQSAFAIALEGECDPRREPERGARLGALLDAITDSHLDTIRLACQRLDEAATCAQLRNYGFRPIDENDVNAQFVQPGCCVHCTAGA
jgi:hypothetical protein